ncbi:MAG: hypothetical protein ACOCQA_02490 [bacterium]
MNKQTKIPFDNKKIKVFITSEKCKDLIKKPSNSKYFKFDIYENLNKKADTGEWLYRYTGSSGLRG